MQDEYTGLAGSYVIDHEKGIRVPLARYEAEQAAKASANAGANATAKKQPITEAI